MPHTNNALAKARKANRHDPRKPAFLKKKPKPAKVPAPAPVDGEMDGTADAVSPPSTAPPVPRAQHAKIITEYHALEKLLASCTDVLERKMLQQRQQELGGLQAYQEASIHGGDKARGGESGKQCVAWIKEEKVGVDKGKSKSVPELIVEDGKIKKTYPKVDREKLRLLDVGGITGTSYADWKWIDTTYIDLNPQGEHVIKFDFFDFPVPEKLYDVVGLSLVLNFVGSLSKRGEMLQHAHRYLKDGGYMFLVLPLPCLTNSRYMNHDRLQSILGTAGWEKVKQRDSTRLTYWFLRRVGDGGGDGKVWRKEEVRAGVRRNNFCIVVNGGREDLASGQVEMEGVADEEEPSEDKEDEWEGVNVEGDDDPEEEWGGVKVVDDDEEEEEWQGCQ